jgi:hypothetical protein
MWGALLGGQVGSERYQILSKPNLKSIHWIYIIIRREIVSFLLHAGRDELGDASCTEFLRCRPLNGCRDVLTVTIPDLQQICM